MRKIWLVIIIGSWSLSACNSQILGGDSVSTPQTLAVSHWYSLVTHGALGELALEIASDGSFTDSRCVTKIQADFSAAIDPATFTAAAIEITGLDATQTTVDLSASTITTSVSSDGLQGTILFATRLPDVAKYRLRLVHVKDTAGNDLVGGYQEIVFSALKGDADGNGVVDAGLAGTPDRDQVARFSGTIDSTNVKWIRSDIAGAGGDCGSDGSVDSADVSQAKALNGHDVRSIPTPTL